MAVFERFNLPGNSWARNVLLAINAIVFLAQNFFNNQIIYFFAMWPSDILQGQFLWTLITNMFVHANIGHIFFNMWALYIFGNDVEFYFGSKRFLLYYLIWGVVANIFYIVSTLFLTPFWLNIPTLGASGAVFGVMIAYAVAFPRRELTVWLLFPIRTTARNFVIFYILLETFYFITVPLSPMLGGGVAHAAHLGGALAGYLFTQNVERKRYRTSYTVSY